MGQKQIIYITQFPEVWPLWVSVLQVIRHTGAWSFSLLAKYFSLYQKHHHCIIYFFYTSFEWRVALILTCHIEWCIMNVKMPNGCDKTCHYCSSHTRLFIRSYTPFHYYFTYFTRWILTSSNSLWFLIITYEIHCNPMTDWKCFLLEVGKMVMADFTVEISVVWLLSM